MYIYIYVKTVMAIYYNWFFPWDDTFHGVSSVLITGIAAKSPMVAQEVCEINFPKSLRLEKMNIRNPVNHGVYQWIGFVGKILT